MVRLPPILLVVLAGACGGGRGDLDAGDPTEGRFASALVVVVNPSINDANRGPLPAPGVARAGVTLVSDDGPAGTAQNDGVVVLFPLKSGIRTIQVSGSGVDGSFSVTAEPGTIRELALAADAGRVEVMIDESYPSNQLVEVSPDTPIARINDALGVDDNVVFLTRGAYAGDLDVSGRRVTLFGEGILGGAVTLQGNATLSGGGTRIHGVTIAGSLSVPAGDTGVSFARVDGATTVAGGNATVLASALCGGAAITGTAPVIVGNRGLPPTPACP